MATYRAACCVQRGKPLEVLTRPVPTELQEDQVHITNYASVVNYADIERCRGQSDDVPDESFVPGAVAAGVVAGVGAGVSNVKVGDRIVALNYNQLGGMAEQTVVSSERVFHIPESLTFSKAAGATVAYCAAIAALEHKAKVRKGDTVLVSGAAGATGLATADAAKNMYGCEVIALCRGEKKRGFLLERGFDSVIDTTESNLVDTVTEMTGGQGVQFAVDVVGGDMLIDCLKCLATDGTAVVVGFSSGEAPAIPAELVKARSLTVMGLNWRTVDQVPMLLEAAGQGKIDPYICQEFNLDQINEAYQMVWDRRSMGKVVVKMRDD